LELEEAQEMHWAVIRAIADGRKIEIRPEDTIQGSFESRKVWQPWEAREGRLSGIQSTQPQNERMGELQDAIMDANLKDEINRVTGAQFQDKMFEGPGIYKGQQNPATVSTTFAGFTKTPNPEAGVARGIDPASLERLTLADNLRMLTTAQDAGGSYMFQPATRVGDINAARVNLGATVSQREFMPLQAKLDEMFGPENAGIIPTEKGYDIRSFNPKITGAQFRKRITEEFPLPKSFQAPGDPSTGIRASWESTRRGKKIGDAEPETVYQFGEAMGPYSDRHWEEEYMGPGGQTKMFLDAVDKLSPQGQAMANSRPVRNFAGKMSTWHQKMMDEGKQLGAEKYVEMLKTYKEKGLAGLREMVAAGTAPAIFLTLAIQAEEEEDGML
jgi:hypothetical protein